MSKDLSETMRAAIASAAQHRGKLIRFPGGFWAWDGWQLNSSATAFGTSTVESLVKRGEMEYTDWFINKFNRRFPIEATLVSKSEQ